MNYHSIILTIYGLPKTHNIPLCPIISGIETAPHNIAKSMTIILTSLLGTIISSYLKNSGDLLYKI